MFSRLRFGAFVSVLGLLACRSCLVFQQLSNVCVCYAILGKYVVGAKKNLTYPQNHSSKSVQICMMISTGNS